MERADVPGLEETVGAINSMSTRIRNSVPKVSPSLCVWAGAFLYALSISFLIRQWVLPEVFPMMHGGNGFFAGGDSSMHHYHALRLAKEINIQGWSAWSLKPVGEPLVGLLAALYAIFGESLIPWLSINALCHSISAVLLFRMVRLIWPDAIVGVVAVLPFVVFPVATYWYSQILKDGFYILGSYMFLYASLTLLGKERSLRAVLAALVWLLAGIGVVWLIRSYALVVFSVFAGLMVLVILLLGRSRNSASFLSMDSYGVRAAAMAIAALVCLSGVLSGTNVKVSDIRSDVPPVASKAQPRGCSHWQKTEWLPEQLEKLAYSLSSVRQGYFWYQSASGSVVDQDACLNTVSAVVDYFPRALQLGLLAPFPYQWLETGRTPGGGAMRRLAGLEMVFVYVALMGLVLGVWRRWRVPEWWLMTVYSLGFLLLYGFVTPNIGALHRMRYGFLMLVVALGVAEFTSRFRCRHRSL